MRSAARLCFSAVILLSLIPGPSNALLSSTCGGTFAGYGTCTFYAAGPGLSVTGASATGALGVVITDETGTIPILVCVSPSKPAHCYASTGYSGYAPAYVALPAGVPLRCSVGGVTSGTYSCSSNTI